MTLWGWDHHHLPKSLWENVSTWLSLFGWHNLPEYVFVLKTRSTERLRWLLPYFRRFWWSIPSVKMASSTIMFASVLSPVVCALWVTDSPLIFYQSMYKWKNQSRVKWGAWWVSSSISKWTFQLVPLPIFPSTQCFESFEAEKGEMWGRDPMYVREAEGTHLT